MTQTRDDRIPLSPLFRDRVAMDQAPQYSVVHKFGAAVGVGTSLVPVTTAKVYVTPTTAAALEVVSDDANDTAAGTGARSITVEGLDENWEEVSQTVAMNGTTAVAIPISLLRVYRLKVATSGTYASSTAGSHAGTITVQAAGAGPEWAQIDLEIGMGLGQSQIAAYTVPAGKRAYLAQHMISIETNKSVNVLLFVRENADTVAAPYGVMRVQQVDRAIVDDLRSKNEMLRGPYTGPCDIGFMAAATSQTADITVNFEIILEDIPTRGATEFG